MRDRITTARSNVTPNQVLPGQADAEIIIRSIINIDSVQSIKAAAPILERTTGHVHGTVTNPSTVNYNRSFTTDITTVVKRRSGSNPACRIQIYIPGIGKSISCSDISSIAQIIRIGEFSNGNSTGVIQIPTVFNGIRIEIHTGTDINIVTGTNHHIAKSVRGADIISVSFRK